MTVLTSANNLSSTAEHFEHARSTFLACVSAGDVEGAVAVPMNLFSAGTDVGELVHQVLTPVQVEVGRRWARNQWGVAEERIATCGVTAVLTLMHRSLTMPEGHGHLLVACVDDERHELPARMLAGDLFRVGWSVSYLGESLPATELRVFAARHHLDAVLLSGTTATSLTAAKRCVDAVHDLAIPVIVGGRAFGQGTLRAERIGADGFATGSSGVTSLLHHPPSFARVRKQLTTRQPSEWEALDGQRTQFAEKAADRFGLDRHEHHGSVVAQLTELTRVVAGAILVGDPSVLDDYVNWLAGYHESRGWGVTVVCEQVQNLASVLPDHFPVAREMLGHTQDRLAEHLETTSPPTVSIPSRNLVRSRPISEPVSESARLAAVTSYEGFASDAATVFDELVGMAATLSAAPVAFLSLVDDHAQRFKAAQGFGFPELSLDVASCTLTIAHRDLVIIPDLTADQRFAQHPLVTAGPRWRFYAGAPLLAGGLAIGTLAIVDYRPRLLRVDQQRHLMTLARQAMVELELRRRGERESDDAPTCAFSRAEAKSMLSRVIDVRDSSPSAGAALGTREVARLLNVTPRTVINWASQGKLNALQTGGGHYRFSADAVIDFLVRGGVEPEELSS